MMQTSSIVEMVMCEWRCVITVNLYVYFVDHCPVPFLHPFDFYEIIFILLVQHSSNSDT